MNQPGGPVQPYYQPAPEPTQPKKPWVHGLLSAIIPGLGSMMAGDAAIGALLLLGLWVVYPLAFAFVLLTAAGVEASAGGTGASVVVTWVVMILAGPAVYAYGIARGAVAAHRWNRTRGLS